MVFPIEVSRYWVILLSSDVRYIYMFVGGKHVSSKLRNCLPMFDATCLLYGGLNHACDVSFSFVFLFCCFGCYCLWVLVCTLICSYIHFFLEHLGKVGLPFGIFFHWIDMFDSLLLMLSGMFLIMFGGWLLLWCTYKGVLLGFMNGLCTPVLKSIVMSRKSIIFFFFCFDCDVELVFFEDFAYFFLDIFCFSCCLVKITFDVNNDSLDRPSFESG